MTEAEKHVRYRVIGDVGADLLSRLNELTAEHGLCSAEVVRVLVTLLQVKAYNSLQEHYMTTEAD